MDWLKRKVRAPSPLPGGSSGGYAPPSGPPPAWAPAPEPSHTHGLLSDAPEAEYDAAEAFCASYPVDAPRLLPAVAVARIAAQGCAAWGLEHPRTPRFAGWVGPPPVETKGRSAVVEVQSAEECRDTCLLSEWPIAAGLYDVRGKAGVYYEVQVRRMDGVIALGTACRPYPNWRLPGWNRLSTGLHLDDLRKFCEDPNGGQDLCPTPVPSFPFPSTISPGDTLGCGLDFSAAAVFFTYNGVRLAPNAFAGLYAPRERWDVYAAIGVVGRTEFGVNFGGEPFRWKEGNEWAWRVEGHVGRLPGGPGPSTSGGGDGEELPTYAEARYAR